MTRIEWTEHTWNPIVGCSIASPGCKNCYAMSMAARIERMNPELAHYRGLTQRSNGKPVWTGKLALAPDETLFEPLMRKKPTMYFVNSMGDLFHEDVPDGWIMTVLDVMWRTPQHTYQVLTKRPKRMREFFAKWRDLSGEHLTEFKGVEGPDAVRKAHPSGRGQLFAAYLDTLLERSGGKVPQGAAWPTFDWLGGMKWWPNFPPNVWFGVSCERQKEAEERIPDLLATPVAVRFVSGEPLLGGVDFTRIIPDRPSCSARIDALNGYVSRNAGPDENGRVMWEDAEKCERLDWVIVGGESGPGARPLWVPHARAIVRQCKSAGVPVFVKQLGANVQDRNDAGFDGSDETEWPVEIAAEDRIEHDLSGHRDGYQGAPVRVRLRNRKGADLSEWPEDLRVRQWSFAGRELNPTEAIQ